jgi:hypothetical protein
MGRRNINRITTAFLLAHIHTVEWRPLLLSSKVIFFIRITLDTKALLMPVESNG